MVGVIGDEGLEVGAGFIELVDLEVEVGEDPVGIGVVGFDGGEVG